MNALAIASLVLAAIPLTLVAINLALYRAPRRADTDIGALVSVLVPARDEQDNIAELMRSVLASRHVDLELLVLDDNSSDRTAAIVTEFARNDPRVRLLSGAPLEPGWAGKVFACAQLAQAARGDWLLFVDADVRITDDAVARLVAHAERKKVDLLSGIPRQQTSTFGERLIIPLIHLVLLGYLPLAFMRLTRHPGFAAAIGQLLLARRATYERVGGHGAVRDRIHDAMALARAFRRRGAVTDLVDLQSLASCRMYRSFEQVWLGFAKNAHEGMGAPAAIGIWTTLLLGGHVLPFVLVLVPGSGAAGAIALAAVGFALLTRLLLTLRFDQSIVGALAHPLGVAAIVAIQWHALAARALRRPIAWKGRIPA